MKRFWILISILWLATCGGGGGSPTEPKEPAPVANFTATPTTLIQGQAVTFTSTSTGTITSYAWNVDADPAIEGTTATYTHTYEEVGTYSITLTVTGPGGSNPKTVADMITVSTAAPTPTTATSQTTQEDGSTTISLTATDPNGQAVTFAITTDPTNGTATLSGTDITYTPNANFYGTDSFDYTASNGTYTSDPVTITITVEGQDDEPTTNDISATTDEDTAVTLTLDATEIDGDNYSFSIISQPTNGTLGSINGNQVEYTPNQDFNETDTFTFEATDDRTFRRNVATATITVNPVNDAPVANDVTASMNENKEFTRLMPVTITLDATDVEGDDLTFSIVGTPSNGTLGSISDNQIIYTPSQDWNGEDTFTYKANDGTADSNTATVTVTVTSVNDAPVTTDQSATTDEDTAVDITLTATDVENDNLTFTIVSDVSNGTTSLSGTTVTYTPTANFNGTDTFTYKANDGTDDSNISTVTVTVNSVNDAPVANDVTASTQSRTSNMRQAVTITLDATDVEGDNLTYSLVSDVSNGTTSLSDNIVTYTPTANYDGTDTFTYKANDGTVDSNIATGTITVENVNLPPTSESASYTIPDNYDSQFKLFGEDDSLTASLLSYSIVDQPSNGTVSVSNNIITYNPGNFSGTDSFTYKVNDGVQDSDIATISLEIINSYFEDFSQSALEFSGGYHHKILLSGNTFFVGTHWMDYFYLIDENFQEIGRYNWTDINANSGLANRKMSLDDGNIIISGRATAFTPNKVGYHELNSSFDLISEKYLSLNSQTTGKPSIYDSRKTSDGGKILLGYHNSTLYVLKLNSDLNVTSSKEWDLNSEFGGGVGNIDENKFDYKIYETSDDGFLIYVGKTLIKIDSSFNVLWYNKFNTHNNNPYLKLIRLNNGKFALLEDYSAYEPGISNSTVYQSIYGSINIYDDSGFINKIELQNYFHTNDFIELANGDLLITYVNFDNYMPTLTLQRIDINGNIIWKKDHQFFQWKSNYNFYRHGISSTISSDGNIVMLLFGNLAKFDASNGELFNLD